MSAAAALVDVSVEYRGRAGKVCALHRVSASFEASSTTAIIGRSGSGKSTAIAVLALLRTPHEGDVFVDGVNASRLRERARAELRARRIGVVFQSFHLEPTISVLENVILPRTFVSGSSVSQARRDAHQLLEQLQIDHLAKRKPSAISGGEKQRVAVARALINRPAVVLADEPTGNLDESTADRVVHQLFGTAKGMGAAVIVVTHDQAVAARADRRLELRAGSFVESETGRESR